MNNIKNSNINIEISIFLYASIWIKNNICLWEQFMFIVTIILFECYIIAVRTKFEFPNPKVGGLGPKKPKTMNL